METTGAGDRDRWPGCDVLEAAASLRWSRPDLTVALAEHRMESAAALGDRDGWSAAAGWRLYAAAAVGDGRDTAAEVLDALARWGSDILRRPAADRLRMELAVLGHESGEVAAAQALLPGLRPGTTDPELAADVHAATVRCLDENGTAVGALGAADAALAATMTAWSAVAGTRGEIGCAAAQLVGAASARRAGRSEIAIARAVDGLARLDRGRDAPEAPTPSGHLAAALAAEWIAALIDAGRPAEAHDGSGPVRDRLAEYARPTRQLALLRLTLARAAASDPRRGSDLQHDLEGAAQDASASDIPALEHICRTALAEVYESAGRLQDSLESVRLADDADRRHRARAARFRAALARTESLWANGRPGTGPAGPPRGDTGSAIRRAFDVAPPRPSPTPDAARPQLPATPQWPGTPSGSADRPNGNGAASGVERTTILRAVQAAAMSDRSDDRPVPRRRTPGDPGERPGRSGAGTAPADGTARHPRPAPERAAPTGVDALSGSTEPGTTSQSNTVRDGATQGDGANPALGGASADAGGSVDRSDVPAADPWATGTWTASAVESANRPRHADDPGTDGAVAEPTVVDDHAAAGEGKSDAAVRPEADAARLRVESALADPDTWLASAMAELDRIWAVGDAPEADTAQEPPAEVDGCVVVLDLALEGERLSADAAAPTVRRLTRRLQDRLPPESRLRDDGPDRVSVVLPGRDRTGASAWLQEILPGLVDGLAVDAAAGGALLRAAVHDTDGATGAQILQRLDGTRGRNGARTRGARAVDGDAAAGTRNGEPHDAAPAFGGPAFGGPAFGGPAFGGPAFGGPAFGGPAFGGPATPNGSGPNGVGRHTSAPASSMQTPAAPTPAAPTPAAPTPAAPTPAAPTPAAPTLAAPIPAARPDLLTVPTPDAAAGADLAGPPATVHPDRVAPGAGPGPLDAPPQPPSPKPLDVTRHDQSADRRPYLPAGVVVRPGSGGRRHRRAVEPPQDVPDPAEAPDPAPQSPDGLGLADLLAGALAAYRRI